jgi:hypothetical protein
MCACVFLCLCCPVFRWRPWDELLTRPRSPTVCKMIKKLRIQPYAPKWEQKEKEIPSPTYIKFQGRAIAQVVSRWLPNAAVRGSSPGLVMWDFVVDKVALGQVFAEYFGFPCQFSFHQLLQKSSSSIIWCSYNRPKVASVPRDLDT